MWYIGFLGNRFSSKCKSLIKVINSRLVLIKRKKSSVLRILRKDVADLLSYGQEMKAFHRVEILISEQNLSTAYDMIEQFCDSIIANLKVIRKQRECPPESAEAVASLMFAAARFADLPELRTLRSLFTQRYGNSLAYAAATDLQASDCFVNQEFAEIISSNLSSTEKKLNLMREIAKESSIKWDSKAFQEKIENHNAYENPSYHVSQEGGSDVGCIEEEDYVDNRRDDTADSSPREKTESQWEHAKMSDHFSHSRGNEDDHSTMPECAWDESPAGERISKAGRQSTETSTGHSTMPECVWDESPDGKSISKARRRESGNSIDRSPLPELLWDESPERKVSGKVRPRRSGNTHFHQSDDLGDDRSAEKEEPEMTGSSAKGRSSSYRRKSPPSPKIINRKFGADGQEIFSCRTRDSAKPTKNRAEKFHKNEASMDDHHDQSEEKPKCLKNLRPPYLIVKGNRYKNDYEDENAAPNCHHPNGEEAGRPPVPGDGEQVLPSRNRVYVHPKLPDYDDLAVQFAALKKGTHA